MDAIGEAVENVGLAQEIQKGLAKSMQTAPKFKEWEAEINSKASELIGKTGDLKSMRLGNLVGAYLEVEGHPEMATSEATIKVIAKYLVMADKLKADKQHAKLFEVARPLGKGAFGIVYLAFKKDTGAPFAIKQMYKGIAKQNGMLKDVLIEREVLSKLASPFCVNLHYAYHDADLISLVLTLCPGGDLAFLLKSQHKEKEGFHKLPGDSVKYYGAAMASGLQAIHDAGYVYRDLKPQNVLLTAEGTVLISDMGLAHDTTKGPIKQCSGTRGYWSPETIAKAPYTTQPDWWSLGVTMYVLYSDKLPFKGSTDEEKDAATTAGTMEFSHDEPPDLQKVISALCTIDMSARLGCTKGLEDFKAHPYWAGFDWAGLNVGKVPPYLLVPNPNDINAPSKNDVAGFKKPKDVDWTPDDEAKFKEWEFMNKEIWYDEAMFRIKKYQEVGPKPAAGCCVVS